ncbi:MAG: DHA2 family efflux MFS transporter permease subunit [Solirubrobacteraceae bacterium]|nr:DHA2 family efflux MFS transporter permease subunit [Solirubrobacteraceae bacterium]
MSQPSAPGGYANTSTELDPALLRVAAVVVLGTFMSILDTTIVNVAINDLAKEFNSTLPTIQWVSTGYMLALATVIPLTGYFADRFGTKRLYMISIGLFLAGSILSGAAWSAESLIAFRVLQGLGGGMIMPAGMTILTHAAGPQRMGRVMGLVGVPMLLGPILGPILGGLFVDQFTLFGLTFDWRWIFYVNVPVGIVALLMAQRFLPTDESKPHHKLDWLGVLLLSPGMAIFVYGLAETASAGGFGSTKTLVPVIVGTVLVLAFIRHASRDEDPLIDVSLFKKMPVGPSAGTTFLFGTAFFGTMFLVPLYLQIVHGKSAFDSGLLIAPQGIGAMIMMPVSGRLTDKTGPGRIVLVGLALVTSAMLALTQVDENTSLWIFCAILFVNGLGMGSTMMPAMSAAMRSLQRDEVARATSGLNVVQRTGGAMGTAILAVVLTHQLQDRLPGNGASGEQGLGALSSVPASEKAQIVPSIADAFGHTFWWSAVIIAIAFIPAYFLPRDKPVMPEAPSGAGGQQAAQAPALMVD